MAITNTPCACVEIVNEAPLVCMVDKHFFLNETAAGSLACVSEIKHISSLVIQAQGQSPRINLFVALNRSHQRICISHPWMSKDFVRFL